MAARYHVVGFRLSGGSLYFGMTRSLHRYLQRIMEDEHSRSSELKTAAICWVIEAEDEQRASDLKKKLSGLEDHEAVLLADADGLASDEVMTLSAKHGFPRASGDSAASHNELGKLDDPFLPLKERSDGKLAIQWPADPNSVIKDSQFDFRNPWSERPVPDGRIAIPDVLWFDANSVRNADEPGQLRPIAEMAESREVFWHRGSLIPLSIDGHSRAWSAPRGWAMGRYFPKTRLRDHHKHALSKSILRGKNGEGLPDLISAALEVTANRLARFGPRIDYVVSVPPHPSRLDRFGQTRLILKRALRAKELSPELLQQRPDYQGRNHDMTDEEKRRHRDGRYRFTSSSSLPKLHGAHILVVDDICTSGSTLGAVGDTFALEGAKCWYLTYAVTQGKRAAPK